MTEQAPIREALEALGFSSDSLRRWLEERRTWCQRHGGRTHYAEILDLIEECLTECSRTDSTS